MCMYVYIRITHTHRYILMGCLELGWHIVAFLGCFRVVLGLFYVVLSQFATSTKDVCFEGVIGAGACHVARRTSRVQTRDKSWG